MLARVRLWLLKLALWRFRLSRVMCGLLVAIAAVKVALFLPESTVMCGLLVAIAAVKVALFLPESTGGGQSELSISYI